MHLSNNERLPLHLNQQLNFKKVFKVHSHSTRQANAIHIPRFSTAKRQRSFTYIGTKIWNNIPQELKDYPYSKFKITYKKTINSKVCLINKLAKELINSCSLVFLFFFRLIGSQLQLQLL